MPETTEAPEAIATFHETGVIPEPAVKHLARQVEAVFDRALENGVGVSYEPNLSTNGGWDGTRTVVRRDGIEASEFHYHRPHGRSVPSSPLPEKRIKIEAQGIGSADIIISRDGSVHATVYSGPIDRTYTDLERNVDFPPVVTQVVTNLGDKLNPKPRQR